MNHIMVLYLIGRMLSIESVILLLPMLTALFYHETIVFFSYLSVAFMCFLLSCLLTQFKLDTSRFYAREGFVSVALCWVVLAFSGAFPLWISGEIPVFIDALFESVSGFTATGGTILGDVEALSHASLLWRSLTHWLGGMGVLVFMLAIVPLAGGKSIYLMRAESPGPTVSKLTPHLRDTALYLYAIYFGMTLLEGILLLLGGMPLFDVINVALSTAGTGGFFIWNISMAHYSGFFLKAVVAVFMILFGINFNIYFLLLKRRWRDALRIEELRVYLAVIAGASLLIGLNIRPLYGNLGDSLQNALFQVASIITTTGFTTADFNQWPALSRGILLLLMFIGACAGSTGGGMKCSRILLICKSVKKELLFLLHPRSVFVNKLDGQRVSHETTRGVNVFMAAYLLIFVISALILCVFNEDLLTNFSAAAAMLNNIGPGFGQVGPASNYGFFPAPAKLVLIFDMFAGRLEIFPMLLLFMPDTWRRNR